MNTYDPPVILWHTGGRKCVLIRERTNVLTFHVTVTDDTLGDLRVELFTDEDLTVQFAIAELHAAGGAEPASRTQAESTEPRHKEVRPTHEG
jgi:hypothetical protein